MRRVSRRFGFRPVGDEEEWTVYWIDTSVVMERVMDMKRYQVHGLLLPPPPSHPHTSSVHSSHNIPLTENQPLSGHGGDLSEGSSGQEHDPHAQALPQGLQLFP